MLISPVTEFVFTARTRIWSEPFATSTQEPCFPVSFEVLGADIEFVPMAPGVPVEVAGLTVRNILQHHGGDFLRLPFRA